MKKIKPFNENQIRQIRLILNLLKKMQAPKNHKIQIKTSLAECISDD